MKYLTSIFAVLILILAPLKALAQNTNPPPPQFGFPVDCTLGQDCWIVNYADVDPGEGQNAARDYRCNAKTYDGHKGTDFAVRSMKEVRDGVDVLAARRGTVLRVRDGEPDGPKSAEDLKAIEEAARECGNGVLIDHGQSISTIYCHLKQGSVVVKSGQDVRRGEKIAQVGQSGKAEFPHVHIGITWEGATVDPFTGLALEEGCGKFKDNLWSPDLQYVPFSLYDGGFHPGVPDFDAIKDGEENPETLPANSPALVFWGAMYGVEDGDDIRLEVTDPMGRIFVERDIVQDKTRARQYYYTGRKLSEPLESGTYTGRLILRRDDLQKSLIRTLEVTAP